MSNAKAVGYVLWMADLLAVDGALGTVSASTVDRGYILAQMTQEDALERRTTAFSL